jgi:thioredoxin-related protein
VIVGVAIFAVLGFALEYVSFEKAKVIAKKEGKLIMVELTSPSCHYCRWMERTTLSDPEVEAAISKRFVPVRVDVSKESRFEWSMTPTFLFMDSEGKIVKRVPGAWKKKDFLELLKGVGR